MTERRNGAVIRDLTTKETETGSAYVVMPVPASVKKAITVTAAPPERPLPVPGGRNGGFTNHKGHNDHAILGQT